MPVTRRGIALGAVLLGCLLTPGASGAQRPTPTPPDSTLTLGVQAGEADTDQMRRTILGRRTWDWGFTTFHFGAGFLLDYVGYAQDDASKEQIEFPASGPNMRRWSCVSTKIALGNTDQYRNKLNSNRILRRRTSRNTAVRDCFDYESGGRTFESCRVHH